MLTFQHIYHVSVSPTDGNGSTQGQRKTLTRVGFEARTFEVDHRLSYKVRREQVVGNEDVNGTAMNICRYKEGLHCISNVWPCSTYIKNE